MPWITCTTSSCSGRKTRWSTNPRSGLESDTPPNGMNPRYRSVDGVASLHNNHRTSSPTSAAHVPSPRGLSRQQRSFRKTADLRTRQMRTNFVLDQLLGGDASSLGSAMSLLGGRLGLIMPRAQPTFIRNRLQYVFVDIPWIQNLDHAFGTSRRVRHNLRNDE